MTYLHWSCHIPGYRRMGYGDLDETNARDLKLESSWSCFRVQSSCGGGLSVPRSALITSTLPSTPMFPMFPATPLPFFHRRRSPFFALLSAFWMPRRRLFPLSSVADCLNHVSRAPKRQKSDIDVAVRRRQTTNKQHLDRFPPSSHAGERSDRTAEGFSSWRTLARRLADAKKVAMQPGQRLRPGVRGKQERSTV